MDHHNTYDKIIDTVPQLFDMVKDLFKDDSENNEYVSHNPKGPQPPQPPSTILIYNRKGVHRNSFFFNLKLMINN